PFEDLWRPGQLPSYAQGRRALVIADDTTALVTTPTAVPGDNTYREVRTFELAEQGPARVTEVSRATGVFEAPERQWIRDTRPDRLRKTIGEYLDHEYLGTEEKHSSTRPDDLATPFEVTLVAAAARRGWSERNGIEVFLFPGDTFEKLP